MEAREVWKPGRGAESIILEGGGRGLTLQTKEQTDSRTIKGQGEKTRGLAGCEGFKLIGLGDLQNISTDENEQKVTGRRTGGNWGGNREVSRRLAGVS